MEELNILSFATGQYRELVERVLIPSLPTDLNRDHIKFIYDDKDIALPGATDEPRFRDMMLKRMVAYRDYVKGHMGQKVLFLDCDVVFLQSIKEEMLSFLDDYDFAMQKRFNCGIWGVNCNERSLDFFTSFVDYICQLELYQEEIEVTNTIKEWVKQNRLKALELPKDYGFITPNTKIYHAVNGGRSIFSKFCILKMVEKIDFSLDSQAYPETEEEERNVCWLGCITKGAIPKIMELRDQTSFTNRFAVPQHYVIKENMEEILKFRAHDAVILYLVSWRQQPAPSWSILPLEALLS